MKENLNFSQKYLNLPQKGYTLIEILAALFIFVIVVSLIGLTAIEIMKNIKNSSKIEQRLNDIQIMLSLIDYDLSQAIPKQDIDSNYHIASSFYSQNNRLHFFKMGMINSNNTFNRSSIEEVEYYLEKNQFIRKYKTDDSPLFKTQIILKNVSSITWTFLDPRYGEYSLWPPTQDWRLELPTGVKMKIYLSDFGSLEKWIALYDETEFNQP